MRRQCACRVGYFSDPGVARAPLRGRRARRLRLSSAVIIPSGKRFVPKYYHIRGERNLVPMSGENLEPPAGGVSFYEGPHSGLRLAIEWPAAGFCSPVYSVLLRTCEWGISPGLLV